MQNFNKKYSFKQLFQSGGDFGGGIKPMDETKFWAIIDKSKSDPYGIRKYLEKKEVKHFQRTFGMLLADFMDLVFDLETGYGDDGIDYGTTLLISKGKSTFEREKQKMKEAVSKTKKQKEDIVSDFLDEYSTDEAEEYRHWVFYSLK